MIRKYITNPMIIQAVQWDGENEKEIREFIGPALVEFTGSAFIIRDHNGDIITIPMGAWMCLNPAGFLMVSDEVFRAGFTDIANIIE